jgi:hypothetical protein
MSRSNWQHTMRRHGVVSFVAVVLLAALPGPVAAQDSNFALSGGDTRPVLVPGWTFTPSILYQGVWDDNVLVRGTGDEAPRDFLNILNPKADVTFLGRRGQVDAGYDGAFVFYRQLETLNSYDQHARVSARRLVTRHVTLFLTDMFAAVPTTELVRFIAVPFTRTGSQLDDLRTGVEMALSKYTSMKVSYNFQWVKFDRDDPLAPLLRGGHSHGATLSLRHAISENTTLLADYDIQHAIVAVNGTFDVQNAGAGVERKLSDYTRIYLAGGVARVGVTNFAAPRTGPVLRGGILHQYQRAAIDLSYSRSYVPAFGFGGTYQNEEIATAVRLPLSQRLYTNSSVSWRRNEPLTPGDPSLRSVWIEGVVGYSVQPWLRLEGFYAGSRQTIAQPGTERDHNRVGFQIVTFKPLRVR